MACKYHKDWLNIFLVLSHAHVQGQVQLYIRVIDSDDNADDHVDDIYVDISLTPSSSFTSTSRYNGDHGNGVIHLSFRVRCAASFFLDDCSHFCQPTNDSSGHYTCGVNGELICLEGWQDTATNCLTRKTSL